MGAASSAKVLATGSAWRLTGRAAAGRRLVDAVNQGGENEQTIAAFFLVKAGDQAVPLIHEGLTAYGPSSALVEILGSIGTDTARLELQRLASSGSPDLAQAAQHALRILDEIDRSQS
ncbi:hypothetical protein GCM10023168_22070 [Fodinibacter luteus]|uniref:HEAT repeat domain-containing protein n=1 Tax=Fodinibacter luteus TaxID=552064 RepID=A0ABP8KGX5_9MICO